MAMSKYKSDFESILIKENPVDLKKSPIDVLFIFLKCDRVSFPGSERFSGQPEKTGAGPPRPHPPPVRVLTEKRYRPMLNNNVSSF